MARKEKAEAAGAPAWMATFADMMSLLLTFFVLLLSFAEMDVDRFKDALGSIQAALGAGVLAQKNGMFEKSGSPTTFDITPLAPPGGLSAGAVRNNNDQVMMDVERLINERGLRHDVTVENSRRGVILKVQGRMFFSVGTADLKTESHVLLDKIADLMNKFPHNVAIEGHTDNVPVSGGRYSSNWELSSARAVSTLEYLKDNHNIDVKRIHVGGFADTRPVATNYTEEGKAKNRRIEFVFYEE
ncbi:MAG: OmpA family protein [Nitrospiraceae bacterium]|nr:MAG: OmpA family protein [Nitrospiraceae bacterium]